MEAKDASSSPRLWRLNLQGAYKEKIFLVGKFFVNNKHSFLPGDILLLQVIKSHELGTTIKRVRGPMIFEMYCEETKEEAEKESFGIYGRSWKYVIIPSSVRKFEMFDKFNFSDFLGAARAKRYDGQAEAVELLEQDESLIRKKISKCL